MIIKNVVMIVSLLVIGVVVAPGCGSDDDDVAESQVGVTVLQVDTNALSHAISAVDVPLLDGAMAAASDSLYAMRSDDGGQFAAAVEGHSGEVSPMGGPFVVFIASTTDLTSLVGRIWKKGMVSEKYRPYGSSFFPPKEQIEVTLLKMDPSVREVTEWENVGDAALLQFLDINLKSGQRVSTTLTKTISVRYRYGPDFVSAVRSFRKNRANEKDLRRLFVAEEVDCWLLTYEVNEAFSGRGELNIPMILTARDEGYKKVGKTRRQYLYTATLNPLASF